MLLITVKAFLFPLFLSRFLEIGKEYMENKEEFNRKAREMAQKASSTSI